MLMRTHGSTDDGDSALVDAAVDDLARHNRRITRALRTLSAGNRTLLRASDEQTLLADMCRVAVEQGGYRLALVNYAFHDEAKSVRTMAHSGTNNGFIESLNLTWADTERGQGTVGTAIRSGRHCIFRSTSNDPRFRPWREEAIKHHFLSLISLPLRIDNAVIGTFTLLAGEEDAFDDDEVNLLDEVAADLSFGISVIRARIKHLEAEQLAKHALTHDAVTGLLNRGALLLALSNLIEANAQKPEPIAVLVVRLTRLQEIYDGFGYGPGFEVLREFASRLETVLGKDVALARLQSDEFAVFLPNYDAHSASAVAGKLQTSLREPVSVGQIAIDVPATIGMSFYPGHGDDAEMLARRAAMAAREAARKDIAYCTYQGTSQRENAERLALAAELRRAIDKNELVLHFQPKVELRTGRILGSEALVRWIHPKRGLISPMQFIPLAEETGLIRQLTYGIIEAAVRQQHRWVRMAINHPVAVNLSVRNLYDPRLIEIFDEHISTWGIQPGLIDFEITEGALVDDPDTAKQVLSMLRKRGSSIYIDDFGTGYSSLNYLVTLPVHYLKIDRSFVTQMNSSKQASAVVASVISMAHNLGLQVVAEGVETQAEVDILTTLGCDQGQGRFYYGPLPPSEFEALFR